MPENDNMVENSAGKNYELNDEPLSPMAPTVPETGDPEKLNTGGDKPDEIGDEPSRLGNDFERPHTPHTPSD